jgi:hypothetical protein
MLNEFTIHGQDMLDHRNWEVSEKWLRDYKYVQRSPLPSPARQLTDH